MVNTLLKAGLPLAIIAFLYQAIISDVIFVFIAVGRTVHQVNNFPYQCQRIEDPRLSACEDMWLSDATRQLFLACSDAQARSQWMPNIGRFNLSGRSTNDAIIALDIDNLHPIKAGTRRSPSYRVLKPLNFPDDSLVGNPLSLVGLTGIDSPEQISLYFVNNRPSRDHGTSALLADPTVFGANSTIEHFITGPAATTTKHMRTYATSGKEGRGGINTPNNIAVVPGMKGFFITNDHGATKTGIWHWLSPWLGTGDVTYCDTSTSPSGNDGNDGGAAPSGPEPECTRLVTGLHFPNGLVYHPGHDLLYVPGAFLGNINVYSVTYPQGSSVPKLVKVGKVKIPYAMDNLSLDTYTGDIYAAAFPKPMVVMAGFDDPLATPIAPSAAIRIRKVQGEMKWEWEKVIEDADGEVLPASTTVIRDGKTGRLFFSGVYSPFITVCDPS